MIQDLGPAGCKANIEYYTSVRNKLIEQALEAYGEEMKWAKRLQLQQQGISESSLKELQS